ncbi:MAG: response regulator [Anaerolineales bacterium]|nr:response regulator [Anaerolineales bacterium]MCB0005509.1 response regulator [Anaerolineales bacterium]MCB0011952.1 response regulator [Anaerolineales bacterium]MCB0016333.1 response regulator [Anaerolineales bacterium]MCB8962803.1 response regulator [Ardenticatenales bacterium]
MTHVLIVDDDRIVRKIVETNLNSQGYKVTVAGDGLEGLNALMTEKPDVIVMDKMMPNMDGYELTRRIRREPRFAQIPILFLTSNSELEDKLDAFKAGADDYLSKPFEAAEMVARVAALARRAEAISSQQATDNSADRRGHLIAFHSLRGGIGSTSLAVNTAVALNHLWGHSTLLMDLVLASGQISLMLNKPLLRSWADLADFSLADYDHELLRNITSSYDSALDFIAAPSNPIDAEKVKVEHIAEARMLLTRRYDYLVADLPHDFSDVALDILDAADLIVLPLAPEMASIKSTSIALDTYKHLGYPEEKVVLLLNQTFEFGALATKQIESALHHRIDYTLPYAPRQFIDALNRGVPLVVHRPKDPLTAQMEELAFALSREMDQDNEPEKPSTSWLRLAQRQQAGGIEQKKRRLLPFT